jgi:hypothetical protein
VRRLTAGALLGCATISLTGCVVAAGSGDDGTGGFFFLLLPIAFFVLMAGLARRRSRRSRAPDAVGVDSATASEQMLRAELSVLADDVIRLEPQVALNSAARDDYEAATHRYRVAQAAMDYAEAPVDLVRVQRVVDEASWAMSRVRATLDGRSPPAPPASLQRPGSRGEPALTVTEDQRPMYLDSQAPFRSGWFSVGGGLFSGLLLGTMLGGFGGEWVEIDEPDGQDLGDTDW